jgi:hypothetical protein
MDATELLAKIRELPTEDRLFVIGTLVKELGQVRPAGMPSTTGLYTSRMNWTPDELDLLRVVYRVAVGLLRKTPADFAREEFSWLRSQLAD